MLTSKIIVPAMHPCLRKKVKTLDNGNDQTQNIYIAISKKFANSTVPNIIFSIKKAEKEAHIIFHFRYGSMFSIMI